VTTPPASPAGATTLLSWWRLLAFALLFFGLQWAYGQARGSTLERVVIEWGTVAPAVALLGTFWPELAARAIGPRIAAEGTSLNVLNGCEGTDVAFLLLAGMLLAPIGWRARLAGLAVGFVLVFALNQVRVLALFHALRADPLWFERLHGLVAPLLLVMALGLFFAGWIERYRQLPGAKA
jgi:exosortase/archaeosortase family protein